MDTQVQKKAGQQLDVQTGNSDLAVKEKQPVTRETTGTHEGNYFEPQVDIYETADALTLTADIPGVHAEDIQTDLKDNLLTITARVSSVDGKWKPLYEEYSVGHYQRQFRLGQQIDQAKISAQLKDGVLTLTLPKADAAKPRRIEVKAG